MNHGHIGPVRFLTSIEIAKNRNNPIGPSEKGSSSLFKTYVLAGGEGYEEYKSSSQFGTIQTNVNIASNATGYSTSPMQEMIMNNSSINTSNVSSISSYNSLHPSYSSVTQCSAVSNGDLTLGKDDLTNFVLLWEV